MNEWKPEYSPWRHGGWYVTNVRYPSGACGCVSRNYPDRKWRIVYTHRYADHTYRTRDDAARAEYAIAQSAWREETTVVTFSVGDRVCIDIRGSSHGTITAFSADSRNAFVSWDDGGIGCVPLGILAQAAQQEEDERHRERMRGAA